MAIATTLVLLFLARLVAGGDPVYNVVNYGARGDGKTDDSNAFLNAWRDVCGDDSRYSIFLIPAGKTYLLNKKISFEGYCKPKKLYVQIDGSIVAPQWVWTQDFTTWIIFRNINGLRVNGRGQIDGKGSVWWGCHIKNQCSPPYSLGFIGCKNLRVRDIKLVNSPGKHMTVYKSSWVQISGLSITAPGDSPNTDGIYIAETQHVAITNSNIGVGDDCITIGTGCQDVDISNINCGPGHGISIGSLGRDNSEAFVDSVRVSSCNIFNTMTGVRVKTWQGGYGSASRIWFMNINFTSVQTPIVIDQFYCPQGNCPNRTSAVQLNNVAFLGCRGTATKEVGISLDCSQTTPCKNVTLSRVDIRSAKSSMQTKSYCFNARGTSAGHVFPSVPCLPHASD